MKNLFFLCLLFLFSCDSSNINEAFTTSKEKEKYSYRLKQAQRAYDEKKFLRALSIINSLIDKHGQKQELVLFKTYATFGLSGFDPVDMTRRFYGAWQIGQEEDMSKLERFIRAIDFIGRITNDEFYRVYTSDAELLGYNGNLRLPINDAHNNIKTTRMSFIIKAARLLCNQVDEFAQYIDWGCDPNAKESISYESHLLWARIHFAESILLVNTLTRTLSAGKGSLLRKVIDAKNEDTSTYLTTMAEAGNYISEIFPVDNSKAMIRYIIDDWLTVINSYNFLGRQRSRLKGVFDEMNVELREKVESLSTSYTEDERRVIVLKTIFTKKILLQWKGYYLANKDAMSEEEENEFCVEYESLDALDLYPIDACAQ